MQEFRERELPFLSFESKDPTNTASERNVVTLVTILIFFLLF